MGQPDQADHFMLAFNPDHNLWNQAIKAGVCTVGQGAQRVR